MIKILKDNHALATPAVLLTSLVFAASAIAHGGSHGSDKKDAATAQGASKRSNGFRLQKDLNLDPSQLQTQHGGQVVATKWHFFEMVYGPRETRIYVYSPSRRLLNAGRLRGQVVMRVRGNPQLFRYPVKPATDAQGRTYGSVVVDVTGVRDGDIEATFDLHRLPFREEKRAKFAQTVIRNRPRIPVSVVPLTESDQLGVQQQRVCPVMDAAIGEHGQPVKLVVGNKALYVCCEGCIEQVRRHPRPVLTKAARAVAENRRQLSHMQVSSVSDADAPAVRSQASCPVMNRPLGSHGTPLRVVVDGRSTFVCCEDCVAKVLGRKDINIQRGFDSSQDAQPQRPNAPVRQHVAVSNAIESDRPGVLSQGVCPITNQQLGSHGTPIKLDFDGQSVFACCQGCVGKIQQNPELYLSKGVRKGQPAAYRLRDVSLPDFGARVPGASASRGTKKRASCH